MKKFLYLLMVALFYFNALHGQESYTSIQNFVEVAGVSEISIAPDTFYVVITIDEGGSPNRQSAKQQETAMIAALNKADIDVESALTINSLSSIYQKRSTSHTSVNYILKLSSEQQLIKAFDIFDSLNISNVYLERTESSQMSQAKREARKEAIQNARDVATQLVESIGQTLGKCYYINDLTNDYVVNNYVTNPALYARSSSNAATTLSLDATEIRVSYKVKARFYLE